MVRRLLWTTLGFVGMLLAPAVGKAGLVELCEVQPNIDYECKNCTPTVRELPIALFNLPTPSDINGIREIDFTMSMQVPNPGSSGLRLALDGIDTGIPLTGFQKDTLVEKNFNLKEGDPNWLSPSVEAQLVDALKDGQVFASLITDTPSDLAVQLYSDTDVKLCLTVSSPDPVPEPATLLVWGAMGAGLALRRRREIA
jgi:hypothetical protein